MLAAVFGHLPLARLLVETYHCDVNEEGPDVSGWDVMGEVIGLSGKLVVPYHANNTTLIGMASTQLAF